MKWILTGFVMLSLPLVAARAQTAAAPSPSVTISLGARHAHVTPVRQGFTHTGGGNIDVAQPAADTVVVTMTGVAVAGAHPCKDSVATLNFDLEQGLEISFEKPEVKRAKLTVEGRVIGLLRSHGKGGGAAEQQAGYASIVAGSGTLVSWNLPHHSVTAGENLSLNCREEPVSATVAAGKLTLHESFAVTASHPRSLKPCKAASAEFAPDPALDPLWISYWEPFHGAAKKDFGFQVTIKVAPEVEAAGK
jgi:hypothetical protein